jgi:hypothetical protein
MRILIVLLAVLFLMAMLAFSPMVATPGPPLPPRATFTTAPTPDPDATPEPTDPPSAYPYPAPSNEERRTKNDEKERKPPPDSSLIAHLSSFLEGLFGSH